MNRPMSIDEAVEELKVLKLNAYQVSAFSQKQIEAISVLIAYAETQKQGAKVNEIEALGNLEDYTDQAIISLHAQIISASFSASNESEENFVTRREHVLYNEIIRRMAHAERTMEVTSNGMNTMREPEITELIKQLAEGHISFETAIRRAFMLGERSLSLPAFPSAEELARKHETLCSEIGLEIHKDPDRWNGVTLDEKLVYLHNEAMSRLLTSIREGKL